MSFENAILVRSKTRLELLKERFNSINQAKFYVEQSGGNFSDYDLEHSNFYKSLEIIQQKLSRSLKVKIIERSFLSTYIFSEKDLIIVAGQDGLVANTAKYVNGLPIIAVNPDTARYDGILLPFNTTNLEAAVEQVLSEKYKYKLVTMAEATMNDGQRLLAFNDLFIGPASHISARYKITYKSKTESQSSSGVIVSTGAGSTGWLSSVFNMARSVTKVFSSKDVPLNQKVEWDAGKLVFVVREPFLSKVSKIDLSAGMIEQKEQLSIESYMPINGVIFSDGIESDFIKFNSGSIVKIGIAAEKATLVLNQ